MSVSNFKVFITRNGDGAITYTFNNENYRILISKGDPVIKEIFDYFYKQLDTFKQRHYAIAQWIVRDIRSRGYVFRCYANNHHNIRPVKINQVKALLNGIHRSKEEQEYFMQCLRNKELNDMERLLH